MFSMTDWDGQTDVAYLVRTPHFQPDPRVDLLAENLEEIRWVSLAEVTAGIVAFSPKDLGDLLATVLTEGVPDFPREVPVLD